MLKTTKWKKYRLDVKTFDMQKHEPQLSAKDSFWESWKKHRFDLGLMATFLSHGQTLNENRSFIVSDGESFIRGIRKSPTEYILVDGYTHSGMFSKEEILEQGMGYTEPAFVKIEIDQKLHFVQRYQERHFNLAVATHASKNVSQAKLGQKIVARDGDYEVVALRRTEQKGMLITGRTCGNIDWDDFLDEKW